MKNISTISILIITAVLLFFLLPVFAQSLQVKKVGNQNFVIEKVNSKIVRIFPSYGSAGLLKKENIRTQNLINDNLTSINWTLKFSASGKVFKDISFANPVVGYIVTELGAVYKTTDGGDTWTLKMNLGFPYYWYGVDALTPDTVVISGFNNQGDIHSGVIRWSFDGGNTWTNDIVLTVPTAGVGWLTRIHFFDQNNGIVSNEFSGGFYYTTTGGKDSTAWTYVLVNSDLGWFAGNIDADANGNVYTTGIHFAHSNDFGVNWTSGPSVDPTFDGGVDFNDNDLQKGMTGGGEISPSVLGWVHKTDDGGSTWSARLNTFPFPIRAVNYFSDSLAFAFGGSINQDQGAIYSTTDEGTTWNLDISTNAEMFSFDYQPVSADSVVMWSVGSTGGSSGYIGKAYMTRLPNPSIVPVELTQFSADLLNGNVLLNWTTATETNNEGFEIQRKANNLFFIPIGNINGHGTTTEPQYYSFTDKNLELGVYTYRLKQVDFNGTFKYSKEIEVHVNAPSKFSLSQNYPNPFNPTTRIEYTIPKDGFVNLGIFNSLGQKIANLVNGNMKAGRYRATFNAGEFSSGVYYYRLESGSKIIVKKMIVLK